jgi:hypothetical protein
MSGETNLDAHAQLILKTSESAQAVSFEEFIEEITRAVQTSAESTPSYRYGAEDEPAPENDLAIMKNRKIGIDVSTRTYGAGAEVRIGWIGRNDVVEELLNVLYDGRDIYIGTGIFQSLYSILSDPFVLGDDADELTPILEYDYIKIDMSDLPAYTGAPAAESADISGVMSRVSAKMNDAFRDNAALVLTDDFDRALRENNGEYILTLDTASFISIYTSILGLAAENSEEVAAFLRDLLTEILTEIVGDSEAADMDNFGTAELSAEAIREAAVSALRDIREYEIYKLPNVSVEYKVKAAGEGEAKQQDSGVKITVREDGIQAIYDLYAESYNDAYSGSPYGMGRTAPELINAPEMFELEQITVNKIQTSPIEMPKENVVSMEELQSLLYGDSYGMYGGGDDIEGLEEDEWYEYPDYSADDYQDYWDYDDWAEDFNEDDWAAEDWDSGDWYAGEDTLTLRTPGLAG